MSISAGLVAPIFGFLMMKNLSTIMLASFNKVDVLDALKWWLIYILVAALGIFIAKSLSVALFAKVGQKIKSNVRKKAYESVLRKEIGWHDINGVGMITATLTEDVQLLKGAGYEGIAAILEACLALLWGIILAFIHSWPMALIGLVVAPFMAIGTYFQQKAESKMCLEGTSESLEFKEMKSNHSKAADELLADAITNYKTVASFGHDDIIIQQFE